MADEKQKNEETKEKKEQAEGSQKGSKGLFIGILAGIIVVNVVLAFVLVKATMPKPKAAAPEATVDTTSTSDAREKISLGTVTSEEPIVAIVNIAGTDGERFLKIGVVLEFDPKNKDLVDHLELLRPKFKNVLIDQLSQMTLLELNEPNTKDKIRKEYLRRLNMMLPKDTGQIKDVLLDEFIVQ